MKDELFSNNFTVSSRYASGPSRASGASCRSAPVGRSEANSGRQSVFDDDRLVEAGLMNLNDAQTIYHQPYGMLRRGLSTG